MIFWSQKLPLRPTALPLCNETGSTLFLQLSAGFAISQPLWGGRGAPYCIFLHQNGISQGACTESVKISCAAH